MSNYDTHLIPQLNLDPDILRGETVIVTGAGSGIGYEAAWALLRLGANVVIAEIDLESGAAAAEAMSAEFDPQRVMFVPTDVGDERSVQALAEQILRRFGKVDVVINNASLAGLGAIKDLPVGKWGASYRVNLRGPALMAQAFLPDMIGRHHGVFVCVSTSGMAFLGGYETLKAALVQLAATLNAELSGSGVIAFSINPGRVPTVSARKAAEKVAPLMGITVDEFFGVNKNGLRPVEEAGAGFAAAVVFAERYAGQDISAVQALQAANGYQTTNQRTHPGRTGSKTALGSRPV
jgi:NAD(P)-dependent dehydrogenase (short-subunit alcohol dehydrogenase family)